MVGLPAIPGRGPVTTAEGVSGDGNVIVGNGPGAFVWDAFHGSRNLQSLLEDQGVNMDGWFLRSARAASYDGLTIVGLARHSVTGDEAFVAHLDPGTFIPEPGALSLLSFLTIGGCVLCGWLRRGMR
jgi:hypothetical protein